MSNHTIDTYVDAKGDHRWRIVVVDTGDIVADSGEGYANRGDMLNSLFGVFFGSFDETFLTLYQEWHPNDTGEGVPSSEVVGTEAPSVEEQAGLVNQHD